MLSVRNALKENRFVQAINKAPFLQKRIYSGTSGLGVCSTNLVSYVHVFNSLGFFENNHQRLNFSMTLGAENNFRTSLDFSLGYNESKVICLNEHVTGLSEKPLFVSYRCKHDFSNQDFLPYCFVTTLGPENSSSCVHSSSFGTSEFSEKAQFLPSLLFDTSNVKSITLALLTLFPYGTRTRNSYTFTLTNIDKNDEQTQFSVSFRGEICRIPLGEVALPLMTEGKRYKLSWQGPAHSNPYCFIKNRTLFHV